jgi:uncharacterized OB-fold protein
MSPRLGPRPVPGPDDAPYWRALAQGVLLIQRCSDCGTVRHPPRPRCGNCASPAHSWESASGWGTVYSFTIVHHPANPELADSVPYVVALIELDEGPRLVSNVVGVDPERVTIDQRVKVHFEPVGDGMVLPLFTPTEQDR